ncbi:MAG TPA: M20/M25/M40 family metallo-hydrolase [Chloroflexota bacterium]|nr:M20/M25/M40 family metallo-hydrolase [Chloroflexota bacterium]
MLSDLHAYVDANAERFVEEHCDFIRQPSQTGLLDNVRAGARYTAELAEHSGWQAEVIEVGELAPIVLAEYAGPPGSKTLLLYSHYDVISPEPVSEWTYPPYSATRSDGRIYGRGATDAKGNVMSFLKAAQSFAATRGGPPLTLKLIIEGEEERGSGNLHEFMDRYESRLAADAALSFDGGIDASGVPKIGLGTSGMLYVELVATGARKELHSAQARLYVNPAWRLTWALASIKAPDERVLIDGFYDGIEPPSDEDRRLMAAMPWNDQRQLDEAGLESFLGGVRGLAAIERVLFQPGLAICGLTSGFQGEGPKAVIPRIATAKLEFRIVPNQTPERTLELLRAHLQKHGFGDIQINVISVVETAKTDPDADIVRATIGAARELYGEPMLKPTEEYAGLQGAWLGRRLGIPGVQTGIGPPGFRGHATDEFVTEEHLIKGIKYAAGIFHHFASYADGEPRADAR